MHVPGLVAPGTGILTADLTLQGASPDPYAFREGTSFATPHVAGAAAVLLSADATLSVEDLALELLSATVDLGAAGPDNDAGHGGLDLSVSRVIRGELPGALQGVVLSAEVPAPRDAGAAVPFVAEATGGAGTTEYRFWVLGPSTRGAWRLARDYDTEPGWTWQTSAADSGTTTVAVHARTAGSPLNYEAADAVLFTVVDPELELALSPGSTSPRPASAAVSFTAAGSGGSGSYEYRFLLEGPGTGGTLEEVQPFSSSDTWVWQTAPADAGESRVVAQLRSDGTRGGAEAEAEVPFSVADPRPLAVASAGLDLPERGACFVTAAAGGEQPWGRALIALAAAGLAPWGGGRGEGEGSRGSSPPGPPSRSLPRRAGPGRAEQPR